MLPKVNYLEARDLLREQRDVRVFERDMLVCAVLSILFISQGHHRQNTTALTLADNTRRSRTIQECSSWIPYERERYTWPT